MIAVASLSRDSPWRMVVTRDGSPTLRATAVAATASGGATTAPKTSAAVRDRPGTSSYRAQPTTKVAKST